MRNGQYKINKLLIKSSSVNANDQLPFKKKK